MRNTGNIHVPQTPHLSMRDVRPVPKQKDASSHKIERKAGRTTLLLALSIAVIAVLLASILVGVMLGSS